MNGRRLNHGRVRIAARTLWPVTRNMAEYVYIGQSVPPTALIAVWSNLLGSQHLQPELRSIDTSDHCQNENKSLAKMADAAGEEKACADPSFSRAVSEVIRHGMGPAGSTKAT
jgi:hypothetical protein